MTYASNISHASAAKQVSGVGFSSKNQWKIPIQLKSADQVTFSGSASGSLSSRILRGWSGYILGVLAGTMLFPPVFMKADQRAAYDASVPVPAATVKALEAGTIAPEQVNKTAFIVGLLKQKHAELKQSKTLPVSDLSGWSQADQQATLKTEKDLAKLIRCFHTSDIDKAKDTFNHWADQVIGPKTDAETLAAVKQYANDQIQPTQNIIAAKQTSRLLFEVVCGVAGYTGMSLLTAFITKRLKSDPSSAKSA